jgi:anti-sigma-K factor RskA
MADEPETDRDETLIAYVRNRLLPEEAESIGRAAEDDAELRAEIALARGIAAALDRDAAEPAPGELGWARLSRALDAEPARQRPARRPLWQLAAAAAAAVAIWQVAAVPLLTPPAEVGYQPVTEQPAAGFALRVAFAPEATEAEIRELLREVGASVTGGPSAIGLWQLGFADAPARDAALARLEAAPIVESVQAE